jgi:hypothetical protein
MEESKFKFPTEMVDLPSKGFLYPEGHVLSSGKIEMKYMTAREEDILTNQNYIATGIVLDKLLQSLIVTKVDYNDLLVGDKNAVLIAARILGYGKDYVFEYRGEEHNIDLTTLENKPFDTSTLEKGVNQFSFKLPNSGNEVTFRIMDGHLEKKIEDEIKGLKRINKNVSPELTTRLKHLITSINGDSDPKIIRDFVDNYLLASDSRAFREHIKNTQPDINLKVPIELNGELEEIEMPIGVNFFFPDF